MHLKIMKSLIQATLILLIVNCLFINSTTAQISINSDGTTPDASAMLDITSTDKGILIPRMDSTSRKNIANPAIGLMVYDSTTTSFWYYANSTWNNISAILSDADGDTKIQVEENGDDDIIRFDLGGTEFLRLDNGRIEVLNTGQSVFIGEGTGTNDDYGDNRNVFIGDSAGYSNTNGYNNIFQGYQSGYSNIYGSGNIFQGYQSGYSNTTGRNNIFQGSQSGYSNESGFSNIFLGNRSGYANEDGYSNIFLGYQSGNYNTSGNSNVFLGYRSGYYNETGNRNIFQGSESGNSNTTGNQNVFIGYQSGYKNETGSKNVFLGYQVGYNETGDSKLYIDNSNTSTPLIYGDFDSDSLQINGTLNINGVYEFPLADGTANQVLATDGSGALSWSTVTLDSLTDTDGDTKIQLEESNNDDIIRFDLGGTEFMRLDSGRIEILNTGSSIFIGEGAGENDDFSDNQNVFIGYQSGYSNTKGNNNIFQGYQSGYSNTEGNNNTFLGYSSGYFNTSGSNNTFLGYSSGYFNTSGNLNLFLGNDSGSSNETGSKNTFLGHQSGYFNIGGSKNVFLGYRAGYNETGSNKLYIDNSNTTTPLIYGDFDSDSLQINGALSVTDTITLYGEAKFNEPVYINKSLGGLNAFTFTLENLNNKNNAYNNGINIIAGQDSANYNSLKPGDFIRFTRPDSTKIGSIYQDAAGSVALATTSDIRLKTNIQTSQYGLSDILNIQVRDYHYKSDAAQTPQTGFLAQQLHEVFPVAVRVGGEDAKTNPWTVDYSKLTPLLVKGMQEQQEIIEQLTMDNGQLTMENEIQNKRLQALEQQNAEIKTLKQQNAEMKAMLQQIQAQLGNQ